MGGNLSSVVSKCRAKRMQGGLQTRNISNLEENKNEQTKESFFKYSNPNEIRGTLKGTQDNLKKDLLKTENEKTADTKSSDMQKEPILVSSSNLELNRNNKLINDTPVDSSLKQRSFVDGKSEINNKSAYDFNNNKSGNLNISSSKPQNNNLNDINNLQFFLNINDINAPSQDINKNVLCPNLHGNLLWSGEKKECQECENFNYGFYCTIDFYFICFKCYDYNILKTCPHDHELKWVSNKKCFNCCEFNFCMHCEKDNYSVCYKCYKYDFRQTICPNKHEFKYYNFKSCFLCKKKNKCLGCEKDDFYLCLCNMNKNENEVPIELESCSVFRLVPQFQFKTNKCILGHNLIWKKMDNTCFKCEATSQTGLFCEVCEYYSHCIDCYDFKFPVLDCPNSHGNQYYKWVSEKKECLRCKKTHTGYFCSKCEYFVCRKNCVNSIIRKFTGKDKPSINTQNIQNELVLERLNSNNAIFPDDDKNSMIDCSLRDIRIDDLNQSVNTLNVVSARKNENDIKQNSNKSLKGDQSFREHVFNNTITESPKAMVNNGTLIGNNSQIGNFSIEDSKNTYKYIPGANYMNLFKGESIMSSFQKIYDSNKNSFYVGNQNSNTNISSGNNISITKNYVSNNEERRYVGNNHYQAYNTNQNNTDLSYRANLPTNNLVNKGIDHANLEGNKYFNKTEYASNYIVSPGAPKNQTNYYSSSSYSGSVYSPKNNLDKEVQKVKVLDEKYIASSTQDFNLAIWNYLNGVFYKNIRIESEAYRQIVFDSMVIVNEFYLLILYSTGNLSIHDIRTEGKSEIFNLDMGPSYSLLRISDNYFAFGLDSKLATWGFRCSSLNKIIKYDKLDGKVFYMEKVNMKTNNLRILSADERSIKLWNPVDFSFIKDIEYPQSNLFANLSFEQKNLLSFDRILSILKMTDDKLFIYNQTLNTTSLVDLETTECINDSKTFEKKVVDLGITTKRLFSSDMFGNLVSFVDGVATLWELDTQSNQKTMKNNDSNTSYYSSYETLYGKTFLKKIEEVNLGTRDISDMKLLHSISFVTVDYESKVTFWDFHK